MARALKSIAAAAVLIVAADCKTNLTADIYSSDLRDTVAGTTGLTAPATMAFQVPGTDDCPEHTAEISEVMTGIMPFAPRGCESADMESYLLADIQVVSMQPDVTCKHLLSHAFMVEALLHRLIADPRGMRELVDALARSTLTRGHEQSVRAGPTGNTRKSWGSRQAW